MSTNIKEFKIGNTSYTQIPYGTCSTDAGTAAKAVTCSDFTLFTGAIITVKFTYKNSVANATLNVNSTGAKPISYSGNSLMSYVTWNSNSHVIFYYNGTAWEIVSIMDAYADASSQGIVSTGAQTFSGKKTFNNGIYVPSNVNLEFNTSYIKYNSTSGCLEISC